MGNVRGVKQTPGYDRTPVKIEPLKYEQNPYASSSER
jgi:hypothetical protein